MEKLIEKIMIICAIIVVIIANSVMIWLSKKNIHFLIDIVMYVMIVLSLVLMYCFYKIWYNGSE